MSFDVEYDVVVLGSGGSGKSAAYVAAKNGLNVAILEKRAVTGGTSVYAEGQGASQSSEVKKRDKPDYIGEMPEGMHFPTCLEHAQRFFEYSHYRADPEVVKAFTFNSGDTIDFLKSLGVEYTWVSVYAYDQPNELPVFHHPDGLGARCQELLQRACENEGIDIFTSTPGKSLIMENGKVVGVKAQDADGEELNIGAKAVVLATGGFANNDEMIRKYSWVPNLPDYNYFPYDFQNTGDGINMAMEAGGDTRALGTLMIGASVWNKTVDSHINAAGSQPSSLWVDSKGRRFSSEMLATSNFDFGNIIAQRDDGIVYSVIDSDSLHYYMEEGSETSLGDFIPYKGKLSHLEAEIEESVAAGDGAAYKADTLAELAAQLSIDPEVFEETVSTYNQHCDEGYDADFGKPAKFLRPVRKGPFYAFRPAAGVLVSCGGIRVNGNFQVIDAHSEPIEGLYAVGNDASGLYGDTYNLDCPGSANGFAHTSGRLAGRHAAEQITGKPSVI